jgi:hypothetical protein
MRATFLVPEPLLEDRSPRRSLPGSATAMTEVSAKRMLARIPKEYVEKHPFHDKQTHAKIFVAGFATKVERGLDALRRAAHAFTVAPDVAALRAADLETLAAAESVANRAGRELSLLAATAALRGLEDALRVAVRSTFFGLSAGEGGWTTAVWLVTRERHHPYRTEQWLALRHAVCAASEADYQKAVAIARALREGLDLSRRAQLAYLFPDEPWANQDLAESHTLPPPAPHTSAPSYTMLLSAATDPVVIRAELAREPDSFSTHALDLAHVLPPADTIALARDALPPLLQKPKYGPLLKTPPRVVAQVLACFRTREAAAVLAPYAASPILGPIVVGYFRDAPELASAVTGKGDGVSKKGASVVGGVLAKKSSAHEAKRAVATGEAPRVLVDRPWRAKGGRTNDAVVLGELAMLGLSRERVQLPRVVPAEGIPRDGDPWPVRAMTAKELATWRANLKKGEHETADYTTKWLRGGGDGHEIIVVPKKERLWAWNESKAYAHAHPVAYVAKEGLATVPGFVRREWIRWLGQSEDDGSMFHAATCLISPRIAPSIARVAARRKKFRLAALAWLAEHAEVAAYGLIPDAVGPTGEGRDDATAALAYLAARGQQKAVLAAAKEYGKAVLVAIEALLSRDPLALDVAPPKPPAFLRLAELPRVRLAKGGILDDRATEALVEMLQISPLDPAYPGISLVARACEPASLAAFALELVEQWVLGDAPGRHDWMLHAIVHLPSEASTRRLVALAREWARKNQAKAARAAGALATLGTDVALLHLSHIAETTRFDALRKQVSALVLEAASARGLTLDELGDRTVPDAGLDPDGTLRLDYGPKRRFRVTLDETLQPQVEELLPGGKRSAAARALPRPTKHDDAAAAELARERFLALKKELEAIADRQRRRLEHALATQRCWTIAEFKTLLVEHPLAGHLARRLVWVSAHEKRSALFRVAEDRSFADDRDRAFALPEGASIRLAHPARDPELTKAWPRTFGEYAILQPFEQLARGAPPIDARERDATTLERVAGIKAPAKKVLGVLESRGFRRVDPGYVQTFVRAARDTKGGELEVRVAVSPPFEIAYLQSADDATTEPATLRDPKAAARRFGDLDAVSFSELVRDLDALR